MRIEENESLGHQNNNKKEWKDQSQGYDRSVYTRQADLEMIPCEIQSI